MHYLLPIAILVVLAIFGGFRNSGYEDTVLMWLGIFGACIGTVLYLLNKRRERKHHQ